jgi:hypothetical protein
MKQIVSGTNTMGISSSMTGMRRTRAMVSPATNSASTAMTPPVRFR